MHDDHFIGRNSCFFALYAGKYTEKCIFLSSSLGQFRNMYYFCNRKREASPMPRRKTQRNTPLAEQNVKRK